MPRQSPPLTCLRIECEDRIPPVGLMSSYSSIVAAAEVAQEVRDGTQVVVHIAPPSLRNIIFTVISRSDASYRDILSDRRARHISRPRQIICWIARHTTLLSYPQIGRGLNRDHTTVISAVKVIDDLRKRDVSIRRVTDEVIAELAA
jgi:chromosomal replication initiator protein